MPSGPSIGILTRFTLINTLIKNYFIQLLNNLRKLLALGFFVLLLGSFAVYRINAHIDNFSSDYMLSFEDVSGQYDAVIILGAKVYANGALGAIVRDRADMAIKLYNSGKAKKILVSADNSASNYNETKAIYNYLIDNGVPKLDIFLDFAGFDTFDSMYRAKYNFQVYSLLISNHVNYCPRSVYLARHLSMDAYCVTMPKWFKPRTLGGYYRENFAKIKARLNVQLNSKAYFSTSDVYPIVGSGNAGQFY